MMQALLQRLELNSPQNKVFYARLLVVSILAIIAFGCRFGRSMERTYPSLIPFIPYVGLLVLAALLYGICAFDWQSLKKLPRSLISKDLLFPFVGFFIALSVFEYLTELPIERVHILKYTSLTFFCYYAVSPTRSHQQRLIRAGVFAAIVGCSEELAQRWMPDRIFDPKDLVLNLLAVLIGIILLQIARGIFQAKIST